MINTIREVLAQYDLPHKYRVVLVWCIAKLMKESVQCAE